MNKIIKYIGLSLLGIIIIFFGSFNHFNGGCSMGIGTLTLKDILISGISIDGFILLVIGNILLFKYKNNRSSYEFIIIIFALLTSYYGIGSFSSSSAILWLIALIGLLFLIIINFIYIKSNYKKFIFIILMISFSVYMVLPLILHRMGSRSVCLDKYGVPISHIVPYIPNN